AMQGAFLFCLSEIEWDLDTQVGFQPNISAIFQIYRRFDKEYRLTNKLRHGREDCIPGSYTKSR
ncbi:hypothetical protein, partial [Bacillus luti]|uniref:hypothetical protein n=1 Tax=Bacillus luti TaxID=2026191 RepID=UPI00310192F9